MSGVGVLLRRTACAVVSLLACATLSAQDGPGAPFVLTRDIPYRDAAGDELVGERCVVDILHPPASRSSGAGLPTLVWFHAGGLTAG